MNIKRIKAHADEYSLADMSLLKGVTIEEFAADENAIALASGSNYYLLMPDASKHQNEKITLECDVSIDHGHSVDEVHTGEVSASNHYRYVYLRRGGLIDCYLYWSFESGNKFDAEINLYVLDRAMVDMEIKPAQEPEPSTYSSNSESSSARMEFIDRAAIAFMQGYVANCQVPVGAGYESGNEVIADDAYAVAMAMWEARQRVLAKGEP